MENDEKVLLYQKFLYFYKKILKFYISLGWIAIKIKDLKIFNSPMKFYKYVIKSL